MIKFFGKRDEKQAPPVPRPTPPFMPTQPGQSTGKPLSEQLNIDKPILIAPANLPPLPEDISQNVQDVSTKIDDIDERVSNIEQPAPQTEQGMKTEPDQQAPPQASNAKVFVRLDKYNEIIGTVNNMESKVNDLQNALKKINEIRDAEQQIIDSWSNLINEAREKVNEVTSKLPPANR